MVRRIPKVSKAWRLSARASSRWKACSRPWPDNRRASGGAPTSFDRILATRFGGKAVELIRQGDFGKMVAFAPPDIIGRPLEEVVGKQRTVPLDSDLLVTAKALGITFGD